MLKALKFVQGVVSKRNPLPNLTYFCIEHGYIRSFNGTVALGSPIPLNISCKPKALPFIKAIQNCKGTVALTLIDNKLSIKSGPFQAYINTIQAEIPHVFPEGQKFDIDGDALLTGLKATYPFIGSDRGHPWATGVLLKDGTLTATNNAAIIQYWVGQNLHVQYNIPRTAVRELIRLSEAPYCIQGDDKSLTFHYANHRWLRTALLDTEWPDLKSILNRQSKQMPINDELFTGLDTIAPFVDDVGHIYLNGQGFGTTVLYEDGANYELEGLPEKGVFTLDILRLLKRVAKTIDLSSYPKPCLFYGDKIRGVIVGIR